MEKNKAGKMWREEEALKENVYSYIDNQISNSKRNVDSERRYVESGAFDNDHAFTAHSALAQSIKKDFETKKLLRSIFSKPYFAHIRLKDEENSNLQIMLSASEDLDQVILVDSETEIVPFKQSADTPMLTMLYTQYQKRTADSFEVSVKDKKRKKIYTTKYEVELIRNVEVYNREITSIIQYAPDQVEEAVLTVDEFLEKRLDENRANARLSNIISTLQKEQFDIIQTDITTDFVLQGCAGSGKTQCLIHRLFFLRDALGDLGWDKVLLITPSQLFRKYSFDLLRRYRLSNVDNCSLATFYCTLLNAYDTRFKGRQYMFELTEEYLPDEYLHQVYAPEQILKIEEEIKNAIFNHVQEACTVLEIPFTREQINASFVAGLVEEIEKQIELFDERAKELSKSEEYRMHLDSLERLDKHQKALYKRLTTAENNRNEIEAEKEKFDSLKHEIVEADEELKLWKETVNKEIDRSFAEYTASSKALDKSIKEISRYGIALFNALDVSKPSGKRYKFNQENTSFLEEICSIARSDFEIFLDGKTEKAWMHRYSDRLRNNTDQQQKTRDEIDRVTAELEEHSKWIQQFSENSVSIENQRKTYRASLERSKHYLSRLESSVFEQEVWNALQPLKTACGIETVKKELLGDGHQKQTRILYKSDLLFYIKIYDQLHDRGVLPEYKFICIDEGQDLHSADYSMLRRLYPEAVLNVFGDTAQALHEACGISEWHKETGINTVFEINSNYRNTPAIVDFCNKQFARKMEWFGEVRKADEPTILKSPNYLRKTIESGNYNVIVKSRREFEEMCEETGLSQERFDFLDMSADKETPGKIHCYSIFAAKGLEFSKVVVYAKNMNINQKTVACTRAMERLSYYD